MVFFTHSLSNISINSGNTWLPYREEVMTLRSLWSLFTIVESLPLLLHASAPTTQGHQLIHRSNRFEGLDSVWRLGFSFQCFLVTPNLTTKILTKFFIESLLFWKNKTIAATCIPIKPFTFLIMKENQKYTRICVLLFGSQRIEESTCWLYPRGPQ